MVRDLASLEGRTFDLVVIGGGIFGACAARDAARRGLTVAIIDRGDFCSAASANSYKLVHGGLRYLQHVDVLRLRQSSNARRTLLRLAPHLVRPLPIVVPTYGHGMKSKLAMRVAMATYDMLTPDRNRGIADPTRHVPRGRCLSREEVMRRYPGVPADGLTGAAVFCDGQMYNPTRLVLEFVQSAVESGAVAANYVEMKSFLRAGSRVTGILARDVLGDRTFEISGRVVLNAAGPYAEGVLERGLGQRLDPVTPWSRDAYFVVNRPLVDGTDALALPAATHDPEALVSRGERHLFVVPWRGATLLGVWHKVYRGHPDEYTVTDAELDAFIDEINRVYAALDLTRKDVSLWNAGLIPFGENEDDEGNLKFGHRTRLIDHARDDHVEGLLTLIGVRYTTGPIDAARAVDLTFSKLGRRAPAPDLDRPLPGGDIPDFEALVKQAASERHETVDEAAIRPLVHNHGTRYRAVLDLVETRPELGRCVGTSNVLQAEIVHVARTEMVCTLGDVVLRRTDLGTAEYPGQEALRTCADLIAAECGWDAERAKRELELVTSTFPPGLRGRDEAEQRREALNT